MKNKHYSKLVEEFKLEPYLAEPTSEITDGHTNNEPPYLNYKKTLSEMPIIELMADLVDEQNEQRHRFPHNHFDISSIDSPLAMELSRRLAMTPLQAILVTMFMNEGDGVLFENLASLLGCNKIRLQAIYPELEELIKRSYINTYITNYSTYIINPMAKIALLNSQPYNHQVPTNLSVDEFFRHFETSIEYLQLDKSRGKYHSAWQNIEQILIANPQLPFSAALLNCTLTAPSRYLLCSIAFYAMFHRQWVFSEEFIESIFEFYDSPVTKFSIVTRELYRTNMIESTCLGGTVDEDSFSLTQEACQNVFQGLNLEQVQEETFNAYLIDSKKFRTKQLFFNEGNSEKIDQLAKFLQEKNYRKIRKRLANDGLIPGLTCMFYGESGCGKTETARMLAKKTKRMVMLVNLDEIKSNRMGATENNIKRIFARYNNLVQHMSTAPILLIDNADIVINGSIRRNPHNSIESSIRYIILKEMEESEGIIIATANNASNIDIAADYRFLYKIEFQRPDVKTMSKIWKSYVPQITDSEADILANNYTLTGGQIMNIARQLDVNNLLTGNPTTLQEVRTLCDMEIGK